MMIMRNMAARILEFSLVVMRRVLTVTNREYIPKTWYS